MQLRQLITAAFLFLVPIGQAHAQVACNNGDDGYLLDWQSLNWTGGGTTLNQWTVNRTSGGDPVTVSFQFSGNTARFQTGYPAVTDLANGGTVGQRSLLPVADFNNTSQTITLTVNFSTPVYNVAFPLFDVDTIAPSGGSGGFRDNVVIRGANTSTGATGIIPTTRTPTFTLPTTNLPPSTVELFSSDGGRVRGINGDSAVTQSLGTANTVFSEPINRFTWVYGNSGITTSNPAQQGVAINDITFCVPRFATVTATKNVIVHRQNAVNCGTFPGSPQGGLPAAIPGSCVEYTIQATNSGTGVARGVDLSDVLPSSHVYRGAQVSGFITTEPGYSFTTPTAGTDCGGGGCTIALNNGRLNAGATGTIRIRAEVK
jgi:uncharacterized repeat protein (TIGR01451 family)